MKIRSGSHPDSKSALLYSDNFYLCLPQKPLTIGHLCIMPYANLHVDSFADLSPELLDEVVFLRELVSAFYRDKRILDIEASMSIELGRLKSTEFRGLNCWPISIRGSELIGLQGRTIDGLAELAAVVGDQPYIIIQSSEINTKFPYGAAQRENWISTAFFGGSESVNVQGFTELIQDRIKKAGQSITWKPQDDFYNSFIIWVQSSKWFITSFQSGKLHIDFLKSVVSANVAGNDFVAEKYYKTWRNKLQYGAISKFLKFFPDNLDVPPAIVDLGCGPGTYLKVFYTLGLRCSAVDISPEMLSIAKELINKLYSAIDGSDIPEPIYIQSSAEDLVLDANSVDGIWYSATIVHTPRRLVPSILRNLYTILKPGGIIYISALVGIGSVVRREGRAFFYYQDQELKAMLNDTGFEFLEEWGGETNIGSQGDTRAKPWKHFLAQKPVFTHGN